MLITTALIFLCFVGYATGALLFTHYFLYAGICVAAGSYTIWFHKKIWLIALFLGAALLGAFRTYSTFTHHNTLKSVLGAPCTVIGTLQDFYTAANSADSSRVVVHVDYIIQEKEHIKIDQPICIYFNHNNLDTPLIQGHNYIFFRITLYQPKQSSSFKLYTLKENFWALANKPWLTTKQLTTQPSLLNQFLMYKNNVLERIHAKCSPMAHKFLSAIFYGKKEDTLSYAQDFQAWGLSHYLARSGLHVSLLITIFLFLLCCIPCSYRIKYIICTFLLVSYACMTFNSISFLRAYTNFFLCLLSIYWYKNIISARLLLLIATAFAIYNPVYLFFLDFQLSYGCTFVIFWFFSVRQKNIAVL